MLGPQFWRGQQWEVLESFASLGGGPTSLFQRVFSEGKGVRELRREPQEVAAPNPGCAHVCVHVRVVAAETVWRRARRVPPLCPGRRSLPRPARLCRPPLTGRVTVGRLRALSGPWLLPVKWGARRSRERGTRERRWRPTPGHAHTRGRPWRDGGRRRHVHQRVQLLSRSWKNEAQRGVNT